MSKPLVLKLLIVICIISISHLKELKAKTEVFFSTEGETKEAVINFIDSAEASLDIAAFIFTSGDIAKSLLNAKKRGVKIRIILDYKQKQNRDPVLLFIKEEGFNLKFVKGDIGGFMHHTFAIRDNNAVITGSYNWTDHSSKYNYENVVLVDETTVVGRYMEEFSSILKNSKPMEGEAEPSNSLQTEPKPVIKKTTNENESNTEGDNVSDAKEERKLPDNLDTDYLNTTFEKLDKIFGKESDLNKSDKKSLWEEKFKGRYVKWEGRVVYRGVSLYDWNKVGIAQNGDEADVQLKFHYTARQIVTSLKIGSTITYTGKLTSLKGMGTTYKLTDCNVISIEKKY